MIAAWSNVDWAFLAIGGFLLGAFLYSGWYTTQYEPEVRLGYAVIGAGISVSVVVNAIVDLLHGVSDWYRGGTLLAYGIVALGLVLVVRERRGHK